jgi:hypothetical protein
VLGCEAICAREGVDGCDTRWSGEWTLGGRVVAFRFQGDGTGATNCAVGRH